MSTRLDRRDFLRIAGLAAGATATKPLLGPYLAQAGREKGGDPYERPWWIKEVDEPTTGKINGDYGRFTGINAFATHQKAWEDEHGEGSYQKVLDDSFALRKSNIENDVEGYQLRDYVLKEGGWTVNRAAGTGQGMASWTNYRMQRPADWGVEIYKDTPEEMAKTIKAAAKLFGAGSVGVTHMQERFIPLEQGGRPILFKDVDVPEVSEDAYVIPKNMTTVIAYSVEMPFDLMQLCPTATGTGASALGYSRMSFVSNTLADYIRGLGYEAVPCGNDTGLSPPFAVYAGLGELGRLGPVVTPEFGPGIRLGKVYTNMPLAMDKPIDFGVRNFCSICMKCADACPVGAISTKEQPDFETVCTANHPGHEAWHNDYNLCRAQWDMGTTSCMGCYTACPYLKQDAAWMHDVVKATTSLLPFTASTFKALDDLAGYGEIKSTNKWWETNNPAFGIYSKIGTERS
jgi:reductive dehalogenase